MALTYAVLEFHGPGDTAETRKRWHQLGYQDVTPSLPNVGRLSCFDDEGTAKRWPQFQSAMVDVEADWYHISGHHSTRLNSDQYANDTGFFNAFYDLGTFVELDPSQNANLAVEVYMRTSAAPASPNLGPNDNPLLTKVHSNCKGVLLIGCYSLKYKKEQKMYETYFPNALIIGLLVKTKGLAVSVDPVTSRSDAFFRKPPAEASELAQCCYELNHSFQARTRRMAYPLGPIRIQHGELYGLYNFPSDAATVYRPNPADPSGDNDFVEYEYKRPRKKPG